MSIFKRKTGKISPKEHKYSKYYSYRFKYNGETYSGTCYLVGSFNTGDKLKCTTEREAEAWERKIKKEAIALQSQITLDGLAKNRQEALASGQKLRLREAWDKFETKAGERFEAMIKGRWNNFITFIEDNFPNVQYMNEVESEHAKEYMRHIRTKGVWIPQKENKLAKQLDIPLQTLLQKTNDNTFPRLQTNDKMLSWIKKNTKGMKKKQCRKRKGYTPLQEKTLSPASQNNYLKTCKTIFRKLADSAKVAVNPFEKIEAVENKPVEREAFSPEELILIGENAKGQWFYPLFIVGIYTGMREGDICNLKWSEIDLSEGFITRVMQKTGKEIEVPILPPLFDYLQSLPQKGEYCFPELADRYKKNRPAIGHTVAKFLTGIGIETNKIVAKRSRAVSVKDIHSLRHTFVYIASKHGVPFAIVQDAVGHVSPEMTKKYMRHASREDKKLSLQAIPHYIGNGNTKILDKEKAIELIKTLPAEKIKDVIQFINQKVIK